MELLENGVILLQENATPHHQRDVQRLVKMLGQERVGISSLLSRSCPM